MARHLLVLGVAKTDETKQFIRSLSWYRRRPLIVILVCPYYDHETNPTHKLTRLGEIIIATPDSVSDPS